MLGVLEIFDGIPTDIWWLYWGYLMGVLKIFVRFLDMFDR